MNKNKADRPPELNDTPYMAPTSSGKATGLSDKKGLFSIYSVLFRITGIALLAAAVYGILVIGFLMPALHDYMMGQKMDSCEKVIQLTFNYLHHVNDSPEYAENPEKARQYAIERLRKLKFGHDNRDYIWIHNPDNGTLLMHPHMPELENRSIKEMTGPLAPLVSTVGSLVQGATALDIKGTVVNYQWPSNTGSGLVEKYSFIRKFKPWNWIIGTGINMDEMEKEVSNWKNRLLIIGFFTALSAFFLALYLSLKSENARSEAIRLQEDLRRQEEQKKFFFDAVNDAVMIVDSSAICRDCNQKATELFGIPREHLISSNLGLISPDFQPDGRSSHLLGIELLGRAMEGEKMAFEWTHRRADGSTFPCEASLAVVPNSLESPTGPRAIISLRDISSRKAVLERVETSEALFRRIFESCPFGIAFLDLETRQYQKINKAFTGMFGYTEKLILGKTLRQILQEGKAAGADISDNDIAEYDRKAMEIYNQLAERGETDLIELKFPRPNTEVGYALVTAVKSVYQGKSAVLTFAVDITERKRLEQQLKQTGKMDILGQLAGGVAHDFNNMLAAILGSAELMEMELPDSPEIRESLDTILNGARRAADLTSKLLAFSRKGKIISTPINFKATIEAAVGLLQRSIDKKITIKTDLQATDNIMTGDPSLLQNALLNLGVNARDAMPRGGEITFCSRNIKADDPILAKCDLPFQTKSYILLQVCDTGTGMPPHIKEKIFEPFFTTKPEGEGTGLGLAAVYGTVMEHQGHISVESTLGKGTCFTIILPNAAENSQFNEENTISMKPVRGSGMVLVIDDEDIIRSTTKSMLQALGYTVELAEDGEVALEILESRGGDFAVILLDMVMPRLSGREILRTVRSLAPQARIIITSGFNREGNMAELKEMGADTFLQKPYRLNTLSRLITASAEELENM